MGENSHKLVYSSKTQISSRGNGSMHDLTAHTRDVVEASMMSSGLATVFVVGSTASITTIEFEPGLERDFPAMLERIAPEDGDYQHEAKWNDDNGHAHVRASLVGPSVCLPFSDGKLELGTWQQIVLIDFDTRPRERTVIIQIIGE